MGEAGGFGWLDWAVVFGLLALTTLVGERMAGRPRSVRDFFLGGRRLPWYAVAASIVATEISAVTFISLPAVVARPGGNLAYLQLGLIGSLLAKTIIGLVLVPAYYEREIYSPYDYMGRRLGGGARLTASALFSIGGVLGQAARVYLTAVVLEVILAGELAWVEAHSGLPPLVTAVCAIGVVAVAWTLIGGIATVVWTDCILFLLFLVGIGVSLVAISGQLEAGLFGALDAGWEAGKLRLLDLDPSPVKTYTIWTAAIASTWGMVGSYGTDQLVAQRLFCCRTAREARRAVIASYSAMIVTCLVALVGVGLWAFAAEHPQSAAALALASDQPDRAFPAFIVEALPAGAKGLVLAGAFAAAISSLDSILAALSQTILSALVVPTLRRRGRELGAAEALRVSRWLVVGCALLLCSVAVWIDRVAEDYTSILDLALAVASYTGGALIAGFFLAFRGRSRAGAGFVWSAPLSVLAVFAVTSHQSWAGELGLPPPLICLGAGAALLALFVRLRTLPELRAGVGIARVAGQCAALALGVAGVVALSLWGSFPTATDARAVLAWPWYLPLGSAITFFLARALASPADPQ
jgi:Na+/proline symporter